MNLTKLKQEYKKGQLTLEEYKTLYINELKDRLNKKGLSHKEKAIEISNALKKLFKEDIRAIKDTLDDKRVIISDIQPLIATRQSKPNNDFSMRIKKSKGIINRHCYK